jgi:hypothetical protein
VDRVHDAVDWRRGRVHGGLSCGADFHVAARRGCREHRVIWDSKAPRRATARKIGGGSSSEQATKRARESLGMRGRGVGCSVGGSHLL